MKRVPCCCITLTENVFVHLFVTLRTYDSVESEMQIERRKRKTENNRVMPTMRKIGH